MIGALFSHFASRSGFAPLAASEGVGGGPVGGPPTNGRAVFRSTNPARSGFLPVSCSEGAGVETAVGRGFEPPPRRFPGATRLMSSLVRRAFSEPEASQEPTGDGPAACNLPDSDCWPMEVVNGQFLFHGADIATTRAQLSAGKGGSFTA